jgi:peptidoglycan/xylan/chitin deacetylase (PgdA/CDA1 family)
MIKTLKKTVRLFINKEIKFVFVFNFHRIGNVDPKNPFHKLHTVGEKLFKTQMLFLSFFGKFVSLEEIRNNKNLSKLNFALTFDDGSRSILKVIPFLRKRNIPYGICLCTEILEKGYGTRDKVYIIIQKIKKEKLYDFVKEKMGNTWNIPMEEFSFYHFSKSNNRDVSFIEDKIINPLFETIDDTAKIIEMEQPYFTIDDIKKHFIGDKLATIVNHSHRHINQANSTYEEIKKDIQTSIDIFSKDLNFTPVYYAVPFGTVKQNLLVNLTNILRENNYRGILWVSCNSNIIKNKYESQMMQLTRIHNAKSYTEIIKTLIISLLESQSSVISLVYERSFSNNNTPEVIAGYEPQPALAFENLVSQGKDYSSDIEFYNYLFTKNPYKNQMPDYYAVQKTGTNTIESIGYNFYIQFNLNDVLINGNYWRSWRKLPFTMASGRLPFFEAVKHTAISAIYKPSAAAEYVGSKKVSWKKIMVQGHILNISKNRRKIEPYNENVNIEVYEACPDIIKLLTKKANEKYYFSIHRTPEFYKWRYDSYPLAEVRYLILYENNIPKGYFVTLQNKKLIFISDFFCESTEYFSILLQKCIYLSVSLKLRSVGIETSLIEISKYIKKNYISKHYEFSNVYAFNEKFTEMKQLFNETEAKWSELVFHETQASGDVLLR